MASSTPSIQRGAASMGAFQFSTFGKPNASIGLSPKMRLRVLSSGTQSSIISSRSESLGIGRQYCGCGQSEPQSRRLGARATSSLTSGNTSENGNDSCLEGRGESLTQQRPVSRHSSKNLNVAL